MEKIPHKLDALMQKKTEQTLAVSGQLRARRSAQSSQSTVYTRSTNTNKISNSYLKSVSKGQIEENSNCEDVVEAFLGPDGPFRQNNLRAAILGHEIVDDVIVNKVS